LVVAGFELLALLCLLSCLVAFTVWLKKPNQLPVVVDFLSPTISATENQAILCPLLFPKNIPVGNLTVNINRSMRAAQGYGGSGRLYSRLSGHDVLAIRGEDSDRHWKVLSWFGKGNLERIRFNPDVHPLADFIRWSLSTVPHVNLCFKSIFLERQHSRVQAYISPQLPLRTVSHLSKREEKHNSLNNQGQKLNSANDDKPSCVFNDFPLYCHFLLLLFFGFFEFLGVYFLFTCRFIRGGLFALFGFLGFVSIGGSVALDDPLFWWDMLGGKDPYSDGHCSQNYASHANTVPQKYLLTSVNYRGTVIAIGRMAMANVLPMTKQVAVISVLAEGSGIRQAERMTGVNRETIMKLGVRVGKGCTTLLDRKMRGLTCHQLQFDELWGFIGKKERHVRPDDDPQLGDVWTFCAIDRDTKLVPSFKVGKRDLATANAFVADVASRVKNRVQISSDALKAYVDAIEMNFGADVDFAQIVKTYIHEDSANAERKYSASEIVLTEKKSVTGFPNMRLASTSNVERLNGTTRLHMRRLTRLTYAFSKKLENFEAAVGLHFAYYNFVKRHNTLRVTPAMEAGIERDFWTVENLIEAAA